MLDSKLCHTSMLQGSVPSYILDDPDFAVLSVQAGGDAAPPSQAWGAGACLEAVTTHADDESSFVDGSAMLQQKPPGRSALSQSCVLI